MFTAVYGSPQTLWVPIVDLDTIYVGQLVACQANEGIVPMATASGANDTTGLQVPMGVVVGVNAKTPVFDTTYKTDKITDVSPLSNTTEYALLEGQHPKGDTAAYAKIALITPETVLSGPIYNAAYGTPMTLGTVTAGDANSVSCTVNALEVAGVANMSTVHFRTGLSRGVYRVTDDVSTTAITWDKAGPRAIAVGDTLVRANGLRIFGPSRAQLGGEAMFFNSAAALTVDYFGIDVITLDLSTVGKEHVLFKFNADHFCLKRA